MAADLIMVFYWFTMYHLPPSVIRTHLSIQVAFRLSVTEHVAVSVSAARVTKGLKAKETKI